MGSDRVAISLEQASAIADGVLSHGGTLGLAPLTAAVVDAGGHLMVLKRADGASFFRPEVAFAKAWGVLAMGWPARDLVTRAAANPPFFAAIGALSGGRMLPVAGGVPVKATTGDVIGAVGVSGDTSQNDERCAVEAILGAGLVPWLELDG